VGRPGGIRDIRIQSQGIQVVRQVLN
jgi:hypothetical protein